MKARVSIILAAGVVLCCLTAAFADSRDWSLLDTKGKTFKFAGGAAESPTLLIFWASWCAPCKKELSDNQKAFEALGKEAGLRILLIAIDDQRTQSKVKPYVESKGFKWRVLLDTNREVLKRYGGNNVPFSVLLDKTGNEVKTYPSGVHDVKELAGQVQTLSGGKSE